ncbi:hypothetical protein [Streptomyces sp. NPDC005251]|uniref:hypothetical protein n=1 Tax=unclassified Streptomyces TaxID=2593676 RepID=UPI00339F6796
MRLPGKSARAAVYAYGRAAGSRLVAEGHGYGAAHGIFDGRAGRHSVQAAMARCSGRLAAAPVGALPAATALRRARS